MAGKLKITLRRSGIGRKGDQKRTLQALGLRKLHQSVVREDTPGVRGQVAQVSHLVDCEEVAE